MATTPPPTPPSPPEGDGTPDGGNPAHATPPEVAPKPGRQSAKAGGGAKKPAAPRRPRAPKTDKAATAAPETGKTPRTPAPRRAASRPRPRAAGPSIATVPTPQPVDATTTDPATRRGGRWWKALAGGLGAIAAGAALFSLRGSSRRKAHQADGTDSSKSFEAGIADEGTIPD